MGVDKPPLLSKAKKNKTKKTKKTLARSGSSQPTPLQWRICRGFDSGFIFVPRGAYRIFFHVCCWLKWWNVPYYLLDIDRAPNFSSKTMNYELCYWLVFVELGPCIDPSPGQYDVVPSNQVHPASAPQSIIKNQQILSWWRTGVSWSADRTQQSFFFFSL